MIFDVLTREWAAKLIPYRIGVKAVMPAEGMTLPIDNDSRAFPIHSKD
jgi:hypothetical protein